MSPQHLLLVLVIVLVVVIYIRGPKTLPLIGKAFGQGVREARKEIDGMKADIAAKDEAAKKPDGDTTPQP